MTRPLIFLLCSLSAIFAAEPLPVEMPKRDVPVDFGKEVFPVLRRNCLACHNETKAKAGLILENPAAILKGGENGPGAVPGDPAKSLIFTTAAHLADPVMPPPNNQSKARDLNPQELGLLKKWISEGAKGESRIFAPAPVKWNRSAGQQVIHTLAISSDGRFIACGRGHHMDLYDWNQGRHIARLKDPSLDFGAHLDIVHSLAFSPDGTLASGGIREIKLWRRPEWLPSLIEGEAPAAPVNEKLVIEGNNARVKDGDKMTEFNHGAPIATAALSPDGSLLVTASAKGKATLWLVKENKSLASLDLAPEEQIQFSRLKAAEAVRERLVAIYTKRVSDLEAACKKEDEVAAESANGIPELELALAAARAAKSKALVRERIRKALDPAAAAPGDDPVAAAEGELASARRKLASALKSSADASGRLAKARIDLAAAAKGRDLCKARAEEAQKAKTATEAASEVIAAGFIDSGTQVVLVLKNGKMQFHAVRDGQHLETADAGQEWKSAVFQGDSLITVPVSGKTATWNLARPYALVRTIGDGKDGNILADKVTALAFSPGGEWLLSGSGVPSRSGILQLWNPENGDLIEAREGAHHDTITSIAFSPDGASFVTGSADRFAKIFSAPSLAPQKYLESHTQQVLAVDWSFDGLTVATGSSDRSVKYWDVESGEENRTVKKDFEIRALRFLSAASDSLAMACGDDTVKNEGSDYENSKDYTYAIALTPDGKYLAAGGEDGKLRVWDAASRKLLSVFEPLTK